MGCIQEEKKQKSDRILEKENVKRKNSLNQVVPLNCSEFVKTLPEGTLDCIITLPPVCNDDFGSGESAEEISTLKNSDTDKHLSWEDHIAEQIALLKELHRATKAGGHLWYITRLKHEGTKFYHPLDWILQTPWKIRQEIIWYGEALPNYKKCTNPHRFGQEERRIYWLRKELGAPFWLHSSVSRWGSVWATPVLRTEEKRLKFNEIDPTFPIYLVLAMIHATKLPSGSLIFDPYGGSCTGSTVKACQATQHYFLTTESDPSQSKKITDRLKLRSDADAFWISVFSKHMARDILDLSRAWEI